MMRHLGCFLVCWLAGMPLVGAQKSVVFPAGVKLVGPYSPGIIVGNYLYISGRGAREPNGRMPAGAEQQIRQALENVKSIVEDAGLTMEHVVYSQVYLDDLANYELLDRLWSQYFSKSPPARAVVGVAHLVTDTPVEINAVAVRDITQRKIFSNGAVSTGDRLFIPGVFGLDPQTRSPPDNPSVQVQLGLDEMQRVLKAAGLDFRHVVFVNPYMTDAIPMDIMDRLYARQFEAGKAAARAPVRIVQLPFGAHIELTGIAVRDLSDRRVVRPKNIAPSRTESPCVFAWDTLYCSAQNGCSSRPSNSTHAETLEYQVRQTMRNLLEGLEEAGMNFSDVVSSNVYLDNVADFAKMNDVYKQYFGTSPPTRTTIEPHIPAGRKAEAGGLCPKLVEISVVAVK